MAFVADGHKMIVKLGPDYTWALDVICPDPAKCQLWHDGLQAHHDPCWITYMVRDVYGAEFLEYWTQTGDQDNTPIALTDGPFEFEWELHEEDMAWRPVRPKQADLKAAA